MKTVKKALNRFFLMMVTMSLFDDQTNVTTDSGMSVEMKTFYCDTLIDNAEPELVHDRWAQKRNIPKGKGKEIEFRKYDPLPKALVPLTEGVTPKGKKLNVTAFKATVEQYGDFIEYSDILELTTIDNNLVEATRLLGSQAGRTLDTITREVLNGGTNVQYGEGTVTGRHQLVGGETSGNMYFTVRAVRKAARFLKTMNAPRIDGSYWAVIHPDCSFDIQDDPDWRRPHEYKDTANVYDDEIGKIAGVRFVETTEAKIFHAKNLTAAARNLTVKSYAAKVVTVNEAISAAEAAALAGRLVIIEGQLCEVASATAAAAGSATITLKDAPAADPAASNTVYPGEAGAKGRNVYSTVIVGADAYGTTELTGGGLQHIVKPLGSAGAADPLNQRGTVGWKATKVAERLVEAYMIRVETASTFDDAPVT